MKIEWKNKADPSFLLDEVSKSRTVNADGSISTSGMFELRTWESVLASQLKLIGTTASETRYLIDRAIRDHQCLTRQSFEAAIRKYKVELDRKERHTYRVVFPILGIDGSKFGRFRRKDIQINFSVSNGTSFYKLASSERLRQLSSYKDHEKRFRPLILCSQWCVASVRAISAEEAYELAYREIRILLGLVIFISTPPSRDTISFGFPQPVSKVHIAPQMTVHFESGRLAFNGFWGVQSFSENTTHYPRPERDALVAKHLRLWLKQVDKCPWPERAAEEAIIKYYDAFSDHNLDDAFLGGWRVLEHVAGDRETKYGKLIERAAAFFDDVKLARLFGLHLTERRNSISHGHSVEQRHSETVLYQMNRLVHPILKQYIGNPNHFKTLDEFHEFCDLASNDERRKRLAITLKKAVAFRC